MHPKASDLDELKKDMKYNESMASIDMKPNQSNSQIRDFGVAFKKSAADNLGSLHLIPIHAITRSRSCIDWKKCALLGSALLAGALLMVLLMSRTKTPPMALETDASEQHWHEVNAETRDGPIQALGLVEEFRTTTTTTTTTEEPETTTNRALDYILASIIANNATVPQMDRTLFSKRSDPYVDLYIIDGNRHRKLGRSPTDKNTLAPKWNYLFEHETRLNPDSILQFEVFDSDKFNMDEIIGRLYVPIREFIMDNSNNGQIVSRKYGDNHRIWFTIHWKPVYKQN